MPDESERDDASDGVLEGELNASNERPLLALPTLRSESQRSGSSHALLVVLSMSLVMAIAASAQLVQSGPQLSGGSDAVGSVDLPARGDSQTDGEGASDQVAGGESKPGCPRPPSDQASVEPPSAEESASSDTVVLKPPSGAQRPTARKKSLGLKDPDYGI